MTKDSEKWLNLFLAVEDIEKIKKSFNNLTTEMLHQKIINLHNELKKKVEKNKNQALEITKLLEQKKDLQEINDTQNKYIKELETKLKDYSSIKESSQTVFNNFNDKIISFQQQIKNQMTNMKEMLKQLEEKDTIISYLESKLK